jgi:MFS superfamily sulfate permease-like transporter
LKLLFIDYEEKYAIIELIGEWNDAIENDIAIFKRSVIDKLIQNGIKKFILIGENVLNFHSSDNCYYEEWHEDVLEDGGWVVMIGLPEQSQHDFKKARINYYVELFDFPQWRTTLPQFLFASVDNFILKRLNR